MKGNILSKKVIMLISAVGITGILLTGCSSKNDTNNGQANAATQQNSGSSSQGNSGNRGNFAANSEARKKQMEDSVNALVTDGTLSKDQGTKVLEALTSFTQRPNRQGQNNQNGQQNNGNNSNTQNGNNQNNNSTGNQQGQNGQRRGNFNPLSKLVSDGTITQDQADKVMAKIRGNMPQRQNNNNGNSNNTNNNSDSNNGTSSS